MMTCDHENISIRIAKDAGILANDWVRAGKDDFTVLTGKQFRQIIEPRRIDNDGYEQLSVGNLEIFKKVTNQLKVLA